MLMSLKEILTNSCATQQSNSAPNGSNLQLEVQHMQLSNIQDLPCWYISKLVDCTGPISAFGASCTNLTATLSADVRENLLSHVFAHACS